MCREQHASWRPGLRYYILPKRGMCREQHASWRPGLRYYILPKRGSTLPGGWGWGIVQIFAIHEQKAARFLEARI
jgi:hypothetical protein